MTKLWRFENFRAFALSLTVWDKIISRRAFFLSHLSFVPSFLMIIFTASIFSQSAFALPDYSSSSTNLSSSTTAELYKPSHNCLRTYVYHHRTYPIDSSRKLDGEGLRVVFKNQSQSEALLDSYQGQLKLSFIPAYVGMGGVVSAIFGPIYANTRSSSVGQRDTRMAFIFSGLFLISVSYLYGQYAMLHKEKTLVEAIDVYNKNSAPQDRISVGLTPLTTGNGGEIKTQVPF